MTAAVMKEVTCYTDGSARGNPGPGGYGAMLFYVDAKGTEHSREFSQGYRLTTNNRMELMGVITALEALAQPCRVSVHSDSKYVVDAFNKHWIDGWVRRGWKKSNKDPVLNADLWQRLLEAMRPHEVSFLWVKGHHGIDRNERADELATTAADGDDLIEDTGYTG